MPLILSEPDLIDMKNAVAQFKITRAQIRRLISQKLISCTRVRGRTIMVRVMDLQNFLAGEGRAA